MSYTARVFNVMIASPSDVVREREIIRDAIREWNTVHAEREGCVLMPMGWESHASPLMGDRPQAIINDQLLAHSDLLVAVFWTKIGSPTGKAPSGTIEEIEEHIKAGKPVMIYFSSEPVRPESVDEEQYSALSAFRDTCKDEGLIEMYESVQDFREVFPRHLQQTVARRFLADGAPDESATPLPDATLLDPLPATGLREEAARLLTQAVKDPHGSILVTRSLGGSQVQTNGAEFVDTGEPRSEALWQEAVEQLFDEGLLSGSPDGIATVTGEGYRVAENLGEPARSTEVLPMGWDGTTGLRIRCVGPGRARQVRVETQHSEELFQRSTGPVVDMAPGEEVGVLNLEQFSSSDHGELPGLRSGFLNARVLWEDEAGQQYTGKWIPIRKGS